MRASRSHPVCSWHRRMALLLFVVATVWLLACSVPNASSPGAQNSAVGSTAVSGHPGNCVWHDLHADERAGGHSLRKHIGRTDEQLLERLDHEHNISGSSTYTDLDAAECAVGAALAEDADKINRWANREGGHSNFVVDYDASKPIGRTLNRGEAIPHPCNHAKVVLAWDGAGAYHVLTTYPECR